MDTLPDGWVAARLDQVVTFNPKHLSDTPHGVEVSFVPMSSVSDETGTIVAPQIKRIEEVWRGYTHFREGDVIFAKITPCMENGKAAIARGLTNGLGCGSTEFYVLRSGGAILPEFLWHFIRQSCFREDAAQVMTGAVGQRRVPLDWLKAYEIPLPPLAEQRRIVARIEALFARTRRARTDLLRVAPLARHYGKRCAAVALDADRNGWPTATLATVTENHDGRRIPIKEADRAKRRGKYPYFGASGAIDQVDDFIYDGDYLLVSEDRANLLSRSTPIAFRASGRFWVNNHAHVLQPKKGFSLDFLEHVIEAIDLSPFVTGSAQPKLTQKALNALVVPAPSLDKQERSAKHVGRANPHYSPGWAGMVQTVERP
jgi:type I restriction enzyme S subunit